MTYSEPRLIDQGSGTEKQKAFVSTSVNDRKVGIRIQSSSYLPDYYFFDLLTEQNTLQTCCMKTEYGETVRGK